MNHIRVLTAATTAVLLLASAMPASAADTQSPTRQTRPGTGVFTGAGNLWSGTVRSAGAPPGGVPGEPEGRTAHERGIADQARQGQAGGTGANAGSR